MTHGKCRICFADGPLSYEHIPPASCFNSTAVRYFRGEQVLKHHFGGRARYTPFQRGHGGYTICKSCNEKTGGWYGRDYAEFVNIVATQTDCIYHNGLMLWPYTIRPLRVVKQILSMMLSINDFSDFEFSKSLREFVLNPTMRLDYGDYLKIYICIDRGEAGRCIGNAAVGGIGMQGAMISDLAFFPLGITMCFDGDMPDNNMQNISWWTKFNYDTQETLYLDLPVLYSLLPYPGVYLKQKAYHKMKLKMAGSNNSMHRSP